ncbi:MAG: hypothetical protein CO103_01800 [Chloroflexi bacterium CG_4_9_14_3_um_filter_45_9]|nr:MAG: hypothetical protein COX52_10715 [Syntrophobacterales bacterium CG23_combo_of_CG06-09_8_20_14_all_48_27]PJB50694.1 MAG: hypothetical protein CO103_01800 [Chloroflexi bacterium CG_4_9_14_3_um_filter_45_9]
MKTIPTKKDKIEKYIIFLTIWFTPFGILMTFFLRVSSPALQKQAKRRFWRVRVERGVRLCSANLVQNLFSVFK